ncbi:MULTISPECIES: precorrin-6y C5,15-methyltransferase (decarboxylating) subunit CbiE [Bradyrhizobium]|jgi:precorrin-6Y C5,15-methyltransferase (decarboxylating)|uniref:Precorrin-6Y C5,15-methyltransferase (Decarboxylating) n=2 Tax=Bradyrhizobium TaxID=374 RepID=A0ABY0PAL6_9BRAD|nr:MULTISPECIES: precorrin-6y C5,15-methyltransferase (decarboxylating) subunit CbiE [Bradyrhizobium]SDH77638.1 precorrin-6Y C5,15-methyltransferase (decarboxylating) [Bradyrhizobium ottawaense]SEE07512.1 precorrin-6Y C5,15-methyltransferase (decarboxylating) [Bradyrhizobium lablabi]SHM03077.1 precorrin-6Y C5,15-methyltransferase (decarboxylating) [Bradyrhizobium lablabi]
MSDSSPRLAADPWLAIVGIGEDGLTGLSQSSRDALAKAEIVFGGSRHLRLAEIDARGRPWPVPFSVDPVLECRGRKVAVLASGDPFWHGAGGSLAAHLAPGEWIAFPAASTFSLAAARLGWRLEEVTCLGLHAAPFETLLPHLAPARHAICLLRDGNAAGELAAWLTRQGFGASSLCVMESLGGAGERIRTTQAARFDLADVAAPVAVAISAAGAAGLPRTSGLPDEAFIHDGQITKRPMRALTLSALAPRPGEILWDIGAGSGSISVEWCLAGGRAFAIETRSDRAANIRANAAAFGVANSLTIVDGTAPVALAKLPSPNAVFVGGGNEQSLFDALWAMIPEGTRLVVNAVTLETEALLLTEHNRHGGELLRIELAQAAPLGSMRGWMPSRPLVQWRVVR